MNGAKWSIPFTRRWGVGLALVTAMVSGVSIFVNGYGVKHKAFANPSAYTTAKNFVAALLLVMFGAAAASGRREAPSSRRPHGKQWVALGAIGVFGGGVAFVLFFEGLARASSVHASFIQKTLVVWAGIAAVVFLREKLGLLHVLAIALLVAGLVGAEGGLSGFRFGSGELMIGAAALLWSLEVVVAKRLLAYVSPVTVGISRMAIGVVVLLGWTIVSGKAAGLTHAGASDWRWALITGTLLSVYVATWFAALARAQVVDVTAVLVLGAPVTALLQAGIQNVPIGSHAIGLVAIAVGSLLVAGLAALPKAEASP